MTFVITTGGIDFVDRVLALVKALAAISLHAGVPWPVVVILMRSLGASSAQSGYFIAYEGIPAFIVTLRDLTVIRGIALLFTQGYSIPIETRARSSRSDAAGFSACQRPPSSLSSTLPATSFSRNAFGRYVTGIGTNAEGVRRAGVNTERVTMEVYVISGLAAAMAGIIIAARLGSGSSNAGGGFELDVIAAVVLGGTSLFGGRGTMIGTMLGALTVAVIGNGLILCHLSPFLTPIVEGVIILVAIWLNFRLFRTGRRTN